MSWRGTTAPMDRFFACLPYLLPLMDAILFYSRPFFSQFPALQLLILPLQPLLFIYVTILGLFSFGGIGLGGLILFIALFALVVRNERIVHFIRFNTMQSIIFGIVLSLFNLLWFTFFANTPLGGGFIETTLFNAVFLGTVVAVIYSIVQSALGRYAEIPTISDAAYMQVR